MRRILLLLAALAASAGCATPGGGSTHHRVGSVNNGASIPVAAATYGKGSGGGQPPDSVAITGGAIDGVTLYGDSSTTWRARGSYVDSFSVFARSAQATIAAADPTINRYKAMQGFGLDPLGAQTISANAADGTREGGCYTTATNLYFGAATSFQNVVGGHWAVAGEVIADTIAGSVALGIVAKGNSARTVYTGAVSAFSSTNFIARFNDGSGGLQTVTLGAYDNLRHIVAITDDGTTVKFWYDGVLVGSTTNRAQLVSGSYSPFFSSDATTHGAVCNLMIGYHQ